MKYFVAQGSVVRQIWGKSDTILFIFAGAAAEFALNKAVDWLYFTGRLPTDPLGRLFSTVTYARAIVFSKHDDALRAIDKIAAIHKGVEQNRGSAIPDWAYRDVLFMLIYYSISAFEVMEHRLTDGEKEEVFNVFFRVGDRMGLPGLPHSYNEWLVARATHLEGDLVNSAYTKDLFKQYRKHLGTFRYTLLLEGQKLVVPQRVKAYLGFKRTSLIRPVLGLYKLARYIKIDIILKALILPTAYKKQISELDVT